MPVLVLVLVVMAVVAVAVPVPPPLLVGRRRQVHPRVLHVAQQPVPPPPRRPIRLAAPHRPIPPPLRPLPSMRPMRGPLGGVPPLAAAAASPMPAALHVLPLPAARGEALHAPVHLDVVDQEVVLPRGDGRRDERLDVEDH